MSDHEKLFPIRTIYFLVLLNSKPSFLFLGKLIVKKRLYFLDILIVVLSFIYFIFLVIIVVNDSVLWWLDVKNY